jgi:hypothetical protein
MSEPHPTSDATPSSSGRETDGRFAKGEWESARSPWLTPRVSGFSALSHCISGAGARSGAA